MSISQWFLKSDFYFLRLDQPVVYTIVAIIYRELYMCQIGTVPGYLTWNILI